MDVSKLLTDFYNEKLTSFISWPTYRSKAEQFINESKNKYFQTPDEFFDMIDSIPENRPLYKDSGLWQVRSDDMEEIYFDQGANESIYEFIKRVFNEDNSYKEALK